VSATKCPAREDRHDDRDGETRGKAADQAGHEHEWDETTAAREIVIARQNREEIWKMIHPPTQVRVRGPPSCPCYISPRCVFPPFGGRHTMASSPRNPIRQRQCHQRQGVEGCTRGTCIASERQQQDSGKCDSPESKSVGRPPRKMKHDETRRARNALVTLSFTCERLVTIYGSRFRKQG